MQGAELVGAGTVLLATVAVGLIAHELIHAAVLRTLGVPYEIEWFPTRDSSESVAGRLGGTWASVTPRRFPVDTPHWGIRLSATAPLALAIPLFPVVLGIVQPPLGTGNPYVTASMVAWLACSIPSPQDFSVFWYADRLEEQWDPSAARE